MNALRAAVEGLDPQLDWLAPASIRVWAACKAWGREAGPDDLRAVAALLLACREPLHLHCYCRALQHRGVQEFDERVVELARIQDARLWPWIYRLLGEHVHPSVGRLGRELLAEGRVYDGELLLLERNRREGDLAAIEHALRPADDPHRTHGLVRDLLDVVEQVPIRQRGPLLAFIYEGSPCGQCRREAVAGLQEAGLAAPWLLEEIRHDAQSEIRALAPAPG